MQPEQAAKATNYVYFPNGNKACRVTSTRRSSRIGGLPDEATLAKLFTVGPTSRATSAT